VLIDEDEQVEISRRMAEPRQHERDLAPMLGRVIHLVDHLLPEGIGPRRAAASSTRVFAQSLYR
jgi:hypothetical protein